MCNIDGSNKCEQLGSHVPTTHISDQMRSLNIPHSAMTQDLHEAKCVLQTSCNDQGVQTTFFKDSSVCELFANRGT